MGKLRQLDDAKSGDDFLRWAISHDCSVRHGKHTVVSNEVGSCAIPLHGHEQLSHGTRRSILKMFLLMGISAVAYFAVMSIH